MRLKILTWNICFGNDLFIILRTFQSDKDYKGLDIIALQEAGIHEGIEDAKRIAQTLGTNYAYFQSTAQRTRGMVQANAIIWNTEKITLLSKQAISLPTYKDVAIMPFERIVKTVIKKEKRNAVKIIGKVGNKTLACYSAHFDVVGFSLKTAQLMHLFQDEAQSKSDIACLAGDLNTFNVIKRPRWTALKQLSKVYNFTDITTNIIWTFQHKTFHYRQKTDAVFIRPKEKINYFSWSKNTKGSDHIPIFAILDL